MRSWRKIMQTTCFKWYGPLHVSRSSLKFLAWPLSSRLLIGFTIVLFYGENLFEPGTDSITLNFYHYRSELCAGWHSVVLGSKIWGKKSASWVSSWCIQHSRAHAFCTKLTAPNIPNRCRMTMSSRLILVKYLMFTPLPKFTTLWTKWSQTDICLYFIGPITFDPALPWNTRDDISNSSVADIMQNEHLIRPQNADPRMLLNF